MENVANSWYYYFSSVAQTIAAASTLLMALAFIRLQYLSNALQDVQRLLAEAFSRVSRQDEYRRDVYPHFLKEEWQAYFQRIRELTATRKFPANGEYATTEAFVDSLVGQGESLHLWRTQLHRSLGFAFGGTVLYAFASIMVIPIAQWVTPSILYWVWPVSGGLLAFLLWLYYRVVQDTLEPKIER